MTTLDPPERAARRLVLIDFDWQGADLLPGLMHLPDTSVQLVAGASPDDAGVRVAALCGLPHTVEIGDLTREIFDVALVGDRSARREQLERLLRALGTPIESPARFLREPDAGERRDAVAAPPETVPEPAPDTAARAALPAADDPIGLERALARWVAATSATAASLHVYEGDTLAMVVRSGAGDPLLESLVPLARRLDVPHVVTREDGAQRGRLWGAWPFDAGRRRAVLAVAAADGSTRPQWEAAVQALCLAWTASEYGESPGLPQLTLLTPAAFTQRLRLAVDRHHADGYRFALHRLAFDAPEEALTRLLEALPARLRGSDGLCRPAPQELLLLCAGAPGAYAHVRARIDEMWRDAWRRGGDDGAPPPIVDERIDLEGAGNTHEFLVTAQDWLSGA